MGFSRRPIAECVRKVSQIAPVSDPNGQFLYVDLSSVDKDEKRIVWDAVQQLSWEEAPTRARQIVNAGDILVSTVRPNLNGVAQLEPSCEGAIASTGFCVLRANPGVLDPRYLFHWLCSPRFIAEMVKLATGASYPAVSDRIIHESLIPLPSDVSEQRRIAAILDKADAIRKKRRKALKLADEFLHSAFLHMFGDPVANPKGWQFSPLGERLEFMTSGSRGWAAHYAAEGARFLRIQNVGKNRLLLDDIAYVAAPDTAEAKRTQVRAGDLLISITADLGRTAVVPEHFGEGYINQHLALLRLRDIEPLFASAWLQSAHGKLQFDRLNRGGVKAGLNFEDLRSLQVALPPRNMQKDFAAIVLRVEQLQMRHVLAEREAGELFGSLAQKAFSGQL